MELTQEGRRLLANQSIAIVDINDVRQAADPIVAVLERRGLVEDGAFLVQSPTNQDRYERLQQTVRSAILDRIEATIRVCQELGARQVTITHVEREAVSRGSSVSAEMQADVFGSPVPAVGSRVTSSSSDVAIDGLAVKSSWSFSGAAADVEAAERALEESGFYDEGLERMIGLFRSVNRPLEHSFEISSESDMRRISDLLAEVSVPFAKARTEIENFKHSSSVVRLRLMVRFVDDPTR
ncbi:hypothetical protein [Geodermatophilus sp. URMC 64]